ncbi:50S ribosomal protein L2 [Candidatus Dependentiae bacterium]|nr:50S ribosomal protein L2 [Candidatus Dependentiae bacterium]MBU4387582.1 50S ribosomal protein L2 [Candidatus Dependentiae bacterium]MCG2756296.1 50S ribosomal protein L2 [Candidatus Dependentiae bacterium]
MAIITRRPVTSSLRGQQFLSHKDLSKKRPEKGLTVSLSKSGGRNAYGRITVRHIGGGAKRKYRIVDFNRLFKEVPGKVVAFEYDPNRNVHLALIVYSNGAKGYILRPDSLNIGDVILSGLKAEAKVGNSLPLKSIPVGFFVHNVELFPGQGAKFARSAGSAVQLLGKEGDLAILKMPSGETRTVCLDCWASVGMLSNAEYRNITLGKAGRTRHRGIRPTVRGMAMNPIDHPHGGGEGRSKSGSHPVTPWGKGCKGTRTRTRKNAAILKRRK